MKTIGLLLTLGLFLMAAQPVSAAASGVSVDNQRNCSWGALPSADMNCTNSWNGAYCQIYINWGGSEQGHTCI